MRKSIILLFGFIITALPVFGTIFKCVKTDGTRYYQDKSCDEDSDIQTELSCYTRTPNNKETKEIQGELRNYRRLISKKRKQRAKKKSLAAKKHAAQKRQRLRLEQRCIKVKQQIDQITQRQRTGYTVVQGLALDRKLAEYSVKRRKYCNNE